MIDGVHFVKKRNASGICWYVYAYRGGPCVLHTKGRAKPTLGTKELAAILKAQTDRHAPRAKTLSYLILRWTGTSTKAPSPEWASMADSTKKTWGSALKRIDEKWGTVPLTIFDDRRMISKIVKWRDSRADTPRAADQGVTVLRALLKYGIQLGLLSINVAADIGKIYQGGQREEIVWTEEDMAAFEKVAKERGETHVWDALRLFAMTGLRRSDGCALKFSDCSQFAIIKKTAKSRRQRRRFVSLPRIPTLDALLTELEDRPRAEGVNNVIVTSEGQPWNPDQLSKAIHKIRDEADIVHVDEETGKKRKKHLHDVRGTFATFLMTQSDLTDMEIADVMGWAPEEVSRIRKVYVDDNAKVVAIGQRIARGVNRNCKPA